jgi:hypothetical protein
MNKKIQDKSVNHVHSKRLGVTYDTKIRKYSLGKSKIYFLLILLL